MCTCSKGVTATYAIGLPKRRRRRGWRRASGRCCEGTAGGLLVDLLLRERGERGNGARWRQWMKRGGRVVLLALQGGGRLE